MATNTTGSLVRGEIKGLRAGYGIPPILYVLGNPSGLIIAPQASGLALDVSVAGGSLYMAVDAASVDWIALGSVAY